MRLDARIPVRLVPAGEVPAAAPEAVLIRSGAGTAGQDGPGAGPDEGPWAAVLALPEQSIMAHAQACLCCSGRTGFSDALGRLFARRARMELAFFTRVVVQMDPDRVHDMVTILRDDGSVAGRFRYQS